MGYIFGVFIKATHQACAQDNTRVLWFNRQHHKAVFSHPIAGTLLSSTLLVRARFQADLQTSVDRIKALWSFNKIYTYSGNFCLEYLLICWQWIR